MYVTYNDRVTEAMVVHKQDSGAWSVDDALFETMGLFEPLGGVEPQDCFSDARARAESISEVAGKGFAVPPR